MRLAASLFCALSKTDLTEASCQTTQFFEEDVNKVKSDVQQVAVVALLSEEKDSRLNGWTGLAVSGCWMIWLCFYNSGGSRYALYVPISTYGRDTRTR